MTFIPYTTEAVTRIKNGATARELGWNDHFYANVCRKHGVQPVASHPPQSRIPPEIAAIAESPPIAIEPLPPATGHCVFRPMTRELKRGEHALALPRRQADVFGFIAKASPENPANGRLVAERLQVKGGGISGAVMRLRDALVGLNLKITAKFGPHGAGYWLADLSNGEPVKVRIIGEVRR